METNKKNKYSNILKACIQILVGSIIFYMIYSYFKKEIISLDLEKVKSLILDLGEVKFLIIILLGTFGMAILSLYDFFVLRAIAMHKNLSTLRIFKISFMTNSLNMILGFGGFIGAGLRYYMYKPYSKDNKKLVVAIGMIIISMLSGISLLSILVILGFLPGEDLYSKNISLYYFLISMSLFLPIYLFINLRKPKIKTDKFLSIKLAIISFFEWIYAAFLVLLILYTFEEDFVLDKELRIIGIIVIASIAGLITMIPGGVGTFDILVLVGLARLGFSYEIVAASILIYRLSYYVIPFLLGFLLLLTEIFTAFKKKFFNTKEGIL
ncbi:MULTISPECIES: lysylphosphatidylglycerol synthase domain-containing protein [unclassified Gemella]|uniref:lysylphosphatidylglycerol synthase domain-containing protein n=1 Tax=unclassified Gemella TaxID=2624949 RepID=UPI001C0494BC|nr:MULTISPECIES: lysylphosphatidylglycerol synthase domain-containing protein [unclassified Gemella]MBU0278872.1 flippase-like domain-containing protein [Gemella sp. zg-1178]QWQ38569.1 flippase-like domain-containing protein [Gemella sp. zg-570]